MSVSNVAGSNRFGNQTLIGFVYLEAAAEPPPPAPAPNPAPSKNNIPGLPFTDIYEGDWYADCAEFAYDYSLFSGTSDSLFSPNMTMTRAMMVQVLYNYEEPEEASASGFSDVAADAWYADAVGWAAENDIVSGMGNGRFAPEQNVSREQAAVILYNYCSYADFDLPQSKAYLSFSDQSRISSWAAEAVQFMYCGEVINGRTDGSFDPGGNASRAEVASMFMNLLLNAS